MDLPLSELATVRPPRLAAHLFERRAAGIRWEKRHAALPNHIDPADGCSNALWIGGGGELRIARVRYLNEDDDADEFLGDSGHDGRHVSFDDAGWIAFTSGHSIWMQSHGPVNLVAAAMIRADQVPSHGPVGPVVLVQTGAGRPGAVGWLSVLAAARKVASTIDAGHHDVDQLRTVAASEVRRPRHRPVSLYRHFDQGGRLLYVGISISPGSRQRQHERDAAWWTEVRRVEVEPLEHMSRVEAEAYEAACICAERPVHNVVHNRRR